MFVIQLATEHSDIALIDGGYKFLTSKDKIIQHLAWEDLVDIVDWRLESTSKENMQSYLYSAPSDRISDKFQPPWSKLWQASKRLGVR